MLFGWVLCTHAFDVPHARRGLLAAGSAALMAVAAAQSVDLSSPSTCGRGRLGLFGLVAMWQSMAGSTAFPGRALAVSGTIVWS